MIEQMQMKLVQSEKAKTKLQADKNDMAILLKQAQVLNAKMEKKAKQHKESLPLFGVFRRLIIPLFRRF